MQPAKEVHVDQNVPDPNVRSAKARDRSCSGIAHDIKDVRPEDIGFPKLNFLAGSKKLHLLVVMNNSYEKQGRPSNYGGNDPGKRAGVGFPTGGSEAKEATDRVALREMYDETGYQSKYVISFLSGLVVMKKNPKGDRNGHPHYPYLIEAETGLARDIKEKKEIKWSRWITFCEIIERLKLGERAESEKRENPESFYFNHAKDFLIPFYLGVYYMKPGEIAAEHDKRYQEWLIKYQPYIIEEIDEHAVEISELDLVPQEYLIDNDQEGCLPNKDSDIVEV